MASVDLLINGRSYTIACDAGEEARVRTLGAAIDEKARQLGSAASDAQRFLMVCLILADELDEARQHAAKPAPPLDGQPLDGQPISGKSEDYELLVAAVDHLADRIDRIADGFAST